MMIHDDDKSLNDGW